VFPPIVLSEGLPKGAGHTSDTTHQNVPVSWSVAGLITNGRD
jgi:hypothetical protein